MSLPPVGCQLIIFGKKYNINVDTDAILDAIAAAGYAAVEGGAKDAVSYRQKLEARGLRFGSMHTNLKSLLEPQRLIDYLQAVGGADICISGLMDWNQRTAADYHAAAGVMNEAGQKLRGHGIHLHYHNHEFELAQVEGTKRGIDILMERLDPAAADLCADIAWIMRGGDDPAAFVKKHQDKIGYLHFKDHDGTDWIELGEGKVDLAGVMKVLPEMKGVRWVMIEQDRSKLEPMESIAISRRNLRERFGY